MKPWSFLAAGLLVLTVGCGDDKSSDAEGASEGTASDTAGEAGDAETGGNSADGDGDGDPTTTGDGDGDPTTTGDGDGDPTTTGDGDGDPTTGDGDGDPTTGDGDGDPNLDCFMLETPDECDANPDCQSVNGSALKTNGPNSPCLEPSEFIGCIPAQGCGDAVTWFCQGNKQWEVPDTCGPENADPCDAPADPVDMCP